MKKKELLVVAFVFGKEYQGYIPIFLFSLYKHYPDYDAMIYVDGKLGQETKRLISLIPEFGEKYKIVLVNKITKTLSPQQMKAYRWLIYDTAFEQYKYLYIGDIDIYICKESVPLHEQHIKHMNSQKLLYSNIVRYYDAPPKWIVKYQNIFEHRLHIPIVKIYNQFFYHKRLSGLHFVNVRAYYQAIKKQRERFFKVYYNEDIITKLSAFEMKLFSNEALLFHIIKKSRLRLPRQVENNINVLMCNDMKSHNFRPYHGVHFGMWRNQRKADQTYDKYIDTQLFHSFYAQFKSELKNDVVLKEIIENSPANIRKIINTMIYDLDNR